MRQLSGLLSVEQNILNWSCSVALRRRHGRNQLINGSIDRDETLPSLSAALLNTTYAHVNRGRTAYAQMLAEYIFTIQSIWQPQNTKTQKRNHKNNDNPFYYCLALESGDSRPTWCSSFPLRSRRRKLTPNTILRNLQQNNNNSNNNKLRITNRRYMLQNNLLSL